MAWYNTTGPLSDTVISSRVRLARNIKGYPFPSRLDANNANEIIEKISAPLESAGFRRINFSDISPIMATSYVERHYVSPEFATMETPIPDEQTTMPLSQSPKATASAACKAKSG